jgi:hypothetical protein
MAPRPDLPGLTACACVSQEMAAKGLLASQPSLLHPMQQKQPAQATQATPATPAAPARPKEVFAEVEINDAPPHARVHLTKRSSQASPGGRPRQAGTRARPAPAG